MSTIMQESTTTVSAFTVNQPGGWQVVFRENTDLTIQLHKGGNENGASLNTAVLVKLDVDGESINIVEVSGALGTDSLLETLDEAIEAQIVVRDRLRKMLTVAA